MQKFLFIIMLALSSIPANTVLAAQIQPTVDVSGSVSGVCRAGTTGSLSFTIDPSLAGPISATATDATVFCSNGTAFTVTATSLNFGAPAASCASADGGITGTLKDGANEMDYTFSCGVGGGTGQGHGSGKDITLGIAGSITAASYQDAPVSASYADNITLTITY